MSVRLPNARRSRLEKCYRRVFSHGLAMLAVVTGAPSIATATTANDLCAPTADPCRVSVVVTVTPGSMIDCGNRQLLVQTGGSLTVGSGDMEIVARDVTVQSNGSLRANGGTNDDGGSITIITDTATIAGTVDASGAAGGTLTLSGSSDISISGTMSATARATDEDGGTIAASGANVTVSGTMIARSGRDGMGGEVDVTARGDLMLSGTINVTGDDGGTVSVDVGSEGAGNFTVTRTGSIVGDTTGADGSGCFLDVSVAGDGEQTGNFISDGEFSFSASNGGDAGSMDIEAAGRIVASAMAAFSTSGRFSGDGGDVDLTTDAGDLKVAADIDSSSTGNGGEGGDVCFDVAGDASVTGPIDARGTTNGGDVDVSADGDVSIESTLRTQGAAPGRSGAVTAEGCTITVSSTATLSSLGPSSLNRLTGKTLTVVNGMMRADTGSGQNQIVFGDQMPVIPNPGSIVPPVSLMHDGDLVPCGVIRTPTPTLGATATPSPTPTPRLVPCLGDCNNDGEVSVDELVIGVYIALDALPLSRCPAFAMGGADSVDVVALVTGVNNALHGCP